ALCWVPRTRGLRQQRPRLVLTVGHEHSPLSQLHGPGCDNPLVQQTGGRLIGRPEAHGWQVTCLNPAADRPTGHLQIRRNLIQAPQPARCNGKEHLLHMSLSCYSEVMAVAHSEPTSCTQHTNKLPGCP